MDRTKLLLLWFAGISLRITVLAVPPLLPTIHNHLHLDETEVGILTALPVFLLATVAVPGSLLVARLGARRALLVGLTIIGVGGALRGVGGSVVVLFGATLGMGCGIAACQPALPSLVRTWLPRRVGLATASYSNGILIGEIIPVAVTAPILVPVLGGWQPVLACWSVVVMATIAGILLFTKREERSLNLPRARWWPDWRDRKVWLLGLTLGGASAAYWSVNAFIPELLRHGHHGAYITPALTALNLGQIPSSLLIAISPTRLVAKTWPMSVAGALTLSSSIGILFLPPEWLVVDVAVLGFASASVFVLALALPPLLAEMGDTHRMSAAMFTIAYACPFVGSVVGGALWDVTGVPQASFAAGIAGGLMMLSLPRWLDLTHTHARMRNPELFDPPVLPG